jgi:CelD/BcsL family acetyltransferase involved in cellulose biosynthesis
VDESGQAEVLADRAPIKDSVLGAWRQLAELRENPFLTPEWFFAWMQANPSEEPFVILWRLAGEVCGVLPLVRVRKGLFHELRFAGARRGDWFTPACRPEDEPAMAAACAELLRRERRSWQLLVLDRVDEADDWPQALWREGLGGAIAPARPRRHDLLPYIAFDEGGYDAYHAGRSRNFRSQLGRRRRKLEKEHELSFRMTTDPDRFDADFDTFFHLHEERWSDRGGSSSGADEVREFQRAFAAAALERGWLRLWIAEADGAPRAAWYGWRIGNRYCYALSGLSKDYETFALGTVLLAHTVEQAAAEGATVYDLMWGDESYKSRFQTDSRSTASWVLGRRRHPVALGAAAAAALERRARSFRGE